MSAATHTSSRRASTDIPARDLELPYAFARTVVRYLLLVLPAVRRELAQWRTRAAEIPNANLRRTASRALEKRGNVEGAALFAALAPAGYRARTVRALVAFQTAYNYLDALSELPSEDPVANGYQLHQALLIALQPGAAHPDYYAHNPDGGDGGYLAAIVDACRGAIAVLPSYPLLGQTAREAAVPIVDFQALNLSEGQGGQDGLERWAREATPVASGLEWWEIAAGAGSSLAVYALIAAAATDPCLDGWDAREIDRAYFPWIGTLHSLLDSLVDAAEDERNGQRNLLSYHASAGQAALAMTSLAERATAASGSLPDAPHHRVIVIAMAAYYLSSPGARAADVRPIARDVAGALGPLMTPALVLFRARRLVAYFTRGGYC
jgi:tetraprenyl-beta-curcumene synthase